MYIFELTQEKFELEKEKENFENKNAKYFGLKVQSKNMKIFQLEKGNYF